MLEISCSDRTRVMTKTRDEVYMGPVEVITSTVFGKGSSERGQPLKMDKLNIKEGS